MRTLKSQQGLSLIELMIAITLGMVIMGAALQFMLSTRQTYDLNDDISRIQENGRMALDIMVKDIQLAGYRHPLHVLDSFGTPGFVLEDCSLTTTTNNAGTPIPICTTEGTGTSSDTLAIQYDPPPDDGTRPETGCNGATVVDTDAVIANVYSIDTADNISSLYCQTFSVSTSPIAPIGNRVPLVDGIDNMQVLYRVTTITGSNESYRFVSYDQLTTDDMPNITAVRIGLLVSNGFATGSAEGQTRTYRVLDSGTITYPAVSTDPLDRQPRRIYSTTVQFNNRM